MAGPGMKWGIPERLARSLGRESWKGIWTHVDPETRDLYIGVEKIGIVRFSGLDGYDGRVEELEERIKATVNSIVQGYRVGLGPAVEFQPGSGEFPVEFFSERERSWLVFLRHLREKDPGL